MELRQKEKVQIRKTKEQERIRKKNSRYAAEMIAVLQREQKKAEAAGVREESAAELEWRMGSAAIKTALLPVQVQVQVIQKRMTQAVLHGGMVILKYTMAAAIPLLGMVLFFLSITSMLSGIAGEEEQTGYASSGYEIAAYAEEWIGVTKYIWGAGRDSAVSWQVYADCSSFVHGVFAHFGYEIGYGTYAQEQAGVLVEGGLQEAVPGDILLFYDEYIGQNRSSHVGIYAGEGQMIHCSGGRDNTSPETAGVGVCFGNPTADGRPFEVRRIIHAAVSGNTGNATDGHRLDTTVYTREQMELIWAVVAQEDNGSYEGALAVISSAMNRTESAAWRYCGSNALTQLTAPGQYCYSIDDYWKERLGGNVPAYVKQAVSDCLEKGVRNHAFTSFRSTKGSATGADAVKIGGNWFFGS